jgi:hypothetical protein
VKFSDTSQSADQAARVQAINAAWAQLQRAHASRATPFHHYILIVQGATLTSSSSSSSASSSSAPHQPPASSAVLRDFERALLDVDFFVAVPSLHALPPSLHALYNATSPVLNPFASGIIAAKAAAASDLFPLATMSSLQSPAPGSSDVGFALSAASVIAHRRFGAKFITMSFFSVQWSRAPPFGIGPSSFLLSSQQAHAQLCSLYDSFTHNESISASAPSSDEAFPDSHHTPAFVSNNMTSPSSSLRPPNCCHVYWSPRNACASFASRDSCTAAPPPTACQLQLPDMAHKWSLGGDGYASLSPTKQSLQFAALPLSAYSFSSVFCHDMVTGECNCSADHCGSSALRNPQLESMTAWTPSESDKSPWLQMDFGAVSRMMGVITRARRDEHQWVREYRVSVSNSSNDSSADAWRDAGQYLGNTDPYSDKINMFSSPVFARYLRLHPIAMFSYRSIRVDVVTSSHVLTDQTYHMPHLLPPPAPPVIEAFRGKRILMIGDSHTRFHYLHLAHWFCFQQQAGRKFVEEMFWQKGNLQWQTYDEKWDEFFRESTFAFDGKQMCDCHRPASWREFGYEIRTTRCSDVEITFVLMYGAKNVLGRLPLHLSDFDVLAQSRAINSVLRCSADNRGCPKGGCFDLQQSGQLQAEVEELKVKLMAQVLSGEVDADDMFNILEAFEKSKSGPPPRVCEGYGGYAWHDASYGKTGNGGVWEFANLTHFLAAWTAATGGADVFFIGQGAHLDFSDTRLISTILSSCSLARKNLTSSRCIWRSPGRKEVHSSQMSGFDAISSAIQSSSTNSGEVSASTEWNIFRPDDLLYHTPPEFYVDSVGHFSGAANDILNNGFLWYLWSLMGEAK